MIDDEVHRIAVSARTEYEGARANEETLAASLENLKGNAVTTNEAMVTLRELDRDVQASRAVYEAFLVRARETGEQERARHQEHPGDFAGRAAVAPQFPAVEPADRRERAAPGRRRRNRHRHGAGAAKEAFGSYRRSQRFRSKVGQGDRGNFGRPPPHLLFRCLRRCRTSTFHSG